MLGIHEGAVLAGQPGHQPFDTRVESIGAGDHHQQVEVENQAEGLPLPGVVLEHVEQLEALPEEEQPDQDETVLAIEAAVVGEHPHRAREEEDCGEREQQ